MKRVLTWNGLAVAVVAGLAVAFLLAGTVGSTAAAETPQEFQGKIAKSYAESEEWWPEPVRPPKGAPNILILLLDDVGFAQVGSFGGLIETPNIDRLAANGLRYNNFHTTALCSPSRATLMTGRNPHSIGLGSHALTAMARPTTEFASGSTEKGMVCARRRNTGLA